MRSILFQIEKFNFFYTIFIKILIRMRNEQCRGVGDVCAFADNNCKNKYNLLLTFWYTIWTHFFFFLASSCCLPSDFLLLFLSFFPVFQKKILSKWAGRMTTIESIFDKKCALTFQYAIIFHRISIDFMKWQTTQFK